MPCDQLNPAAAFLERYSTASSAKLKAKEQEEQRRRDRQSRKAAKQQRQQQRQQQQQQQQQQQIYESDEEEEDDDDDSEDDDDDEADSETSAGQGGVTRSQRRDGTVELTLEAIADRAEGILEALRAHQPGDTIMTNPCAPLHKY